MCSTGLGQIGQLGQHVEGRRGSSGISGGSYVVFEDVVRDG